MVASAVEEVLDSGIDPVIVFMDIVGVNIKPICILVFQSILIPLRHAANVVLCHMF
jgi:hypothetical protein